MRIQKKAFLVATFVMAFIGTAFFLSGVSVGGELEPPNTVPTMPTLESIYQGVKMLLFRPFVIWEENKRFAIFENGTPENTSDDLVLDMATNLIWTRDANIAGETKNCSGRESYIENLVLVWNDWRLPTIEELVSLAEAYPSPRSPALPAGHPFVNVQTTTYYWSMTQILTGYWDFDLGRIDMNDGNVDYLHTDIFNYNNYYYNVWPVRGGQ